MKTRARRLETLPDYPFARWSASVETAREAGRDVIRLDIGNPDLPPPEAVVEALCRAARRPEGHGYPGYRGLPALRRAVAGYYERRFGVRLDPERQVVPLLGSKEGIVHLALAWLDPRDVALLPDPGYAAYALGANLVGAEVYPLPLRPERGFLPDLAAIPAGVAERATLLWLNYPNNPTGATADLAFFAQAVAYARRHGLLLCHDAPYCDVTYDGYTAPSLLQVPGAAEVAVEFNSLSKTYNMAGWRVGLAVGNAKALAALSQVKGYVDSGIFGAVQQAAVEALAVDPAWIAARNEVYGGRLDAIFWGLGAAGLEAARSRATLYAWARVPDGWTSEVFASRLLVETGVALAPGSFFGPGGEGFLRVSATAPLDRVRDGMDRLGRFTKKRVEKG